MKSRRKTNYHRHLLHSLKNPKEAIEYLKAALEESDMPEVFLLALRNIAEARGLAKLAKLTSLNRENLYRMLSRKGNPDLKSVNALLDALGLRLSVEEKRAS
ncbi:MAG: putative addiction module antidote protein [Planctomycetes bacterium]|nr:putative addiction module antidote protein [Planctomycetota bacterium]